MEALSGTGHQGASLTVPLSTVAIRQMRRCVDRGLRGWRGPYWSCRPGNQSPVEIVLIHETDPNTCLESPGVDREIGNAYGGRDSCISGLDCLRTTLGIRLTRIQRLWGQIHTAVPIPSVSTPDRPATAVPVVSEAMLPSLTLIHEGRTIRARRFEGCWTPDSSSEIQCVETFTAR